ncbi:dipeptidase [Thermolongibacillus altinsuensis]|uniref:dipeptidase n=1 Tax=Thermolongibacillus altinsuensis TaxID=575256 RepID=UPI00242A2B3D|nr:dipeptidase [Thermolongibacillus altinsuensis]GMB08381.1 diguanylate cyclase [Thermolongibacillus altinsuensis]
MKFFDAHCDVLFRLFSDPSLSFQKNSSLHVTYEGLQQTGSAVQCFAIYIPESVRPESRFFVALEMIECFYTQILSNPKMKMVRSKKDIASLQQGEIGAMLTLEGCEAIGESLVQLKTLLRLGVYSVGLTWNHANMVADGALETRGGGLTAFGKRVVRTLNEEKCWIDLSHLCERAFWDVIELADYPIASHSNAYSLCLHPRNLRDEQIRAIIQKNGVIGVTFVPQFLHNDQRPATIADVLRHVDHICSLGGENHLGFGSDFDGIAHTVEGLANVTHYAHLINELLKYYSEDQVKKFLFHNFYERMPK